MYVCMDVCVCVRTYAKIAGACSDAAAAAVAVADCAAETHNRDSSGVVASGNRRRLT